MSSVWYGISFEARRRRPAASAPSISTCGGRPTERFRSEMPGAVSSIALSSGSRSKSAIPPASGPDMIALRRTAPTAARAL